MDGEFLDARILSKEELAEIEARKAASKQAALQSSGTIVKHLRLTVDFHITIAGTPPNDNGMNHPDPVYHARQARLLEAVKNTPEALDNWLRSLIGRELQLRNWVDVDGGDTPYEELLAPALEKLPEEDWAYFNAMQEAGMYWSDLVDLFYESFAITGDTAVLSEL